MSNLGTHWFAIRVSISWYDVFFQNLSTYFLIYTIWGAYKSVHGSLIFFIYYCSLWLIILSLRIFFSFGFMDSGKDFFTELLSQHWLYYCGFLFSFILSVSLKIFLCLSLNLLLAFCFHEFSIGSWRSFFLLLMAYKLFFPSFVCIFNDI